MVLGKVKSLTISFDCLNGSNILVYSSGDTVSGRVSLEVTGETRVKSLKIHARGYAKVRWTESRNAGSNTAYTQNYTEEVEYFNHKDVLLGHERGESIQIFAEIENCSSRMVVPKATIYQTQAFYAKGKMKQVKQLVANLCGESLSAGKTETWNGKQLKIPPVSPSILDCSIIRVEYSLMVYVDIPGAMDLFLNLPLVIGTIPLHPFGSRTSSVSSQRSMNMSWLGLTLPERPEAPPSYAEVVTGEKRHSSLAPIAAFDDFERVHQGPLFAYIQKFRFLPPPLYSEIDPNPDQPTDERPSCPSR
ncbi:arrestin domain-containing protein 3-like isoform X2 [Patagioenas fasciata]|uniref:arrestin domain-containing protein 3-like isoform X2 n=1 Tax=Patagioenas fasciata TaxID=372321 RepID=UPI0032E88570